MRFMSLQHSAYRKLLGYVASVILIAGALAATGCGSSSSHSNSSASAAGGTSTAGGSTAVSTAQATTMKNMKTPTSIGQTVALPKRPPTAESVVFLTTGVPSDTQAGQGFAAAAKSLGWQFSTLSYDPSNPATFNTALSNALTKHPSFVAEAGTPTEVISPAILKAYAASKTKLVVDGIAPCQQTQVLVACVADAANFEAHGVAIANWFVANSQGKGKAIVQGTPGYPVLAAEMAAFTAEVKKLCPGCSLKQINATLPQVASGQVVPGVVSALRSNPDYKYLIFSIGDFATGVNSALNAAGLSGIQVAGFGVTAETAAALRAGTQAMWTATSYYQSGYRMADAAARYTVHAPGIQNDDVQPLQVLTKANVGSTTVWNQPSDALAEFEKLWKVPVTPCTLGCH